MITPIISADILSSTSIKLSTTTQAPTDATKILWYKKKATDLYWYDAPVEKLFTDPTWNTNTFAGLTSEVWQFKARFASDTVQGSDSSTVIVDLSATTYTLAYNATDSIAPNEPPNFVPRVMSDSRIDCSWDASTDNIATTGYKVYLNSVLQATNDPATRTCSFTNLVPRQLYTIEISAIDAAGNESTKAKATVSTITDSTPPSAPTNLQGIGNVGSADLAWSASTDNVGVVAYNIYRGGAKIGSSNVITYKDTNVLPDTEYIYQVSAVDGSGNESAKSGSIKVKTQATSDTTAPTAGIISATAVSSSQIDISFTAPSDNVGVVKQELYRNGVQIYTWNDALAHTFSDISLLPSMDCSYQVKVYDAANNTAQSNIANATTQSGGGTQIVGIGLTLAACIAEVRNRLSIGTDTTNITDIEITNWLNFAMDDISPHLNLQAERIINTIQDVLNYDMPTNYYRLLAKPKLDTVRYDEVEEDDGNTGYFLWINQIVFQNVTIIDNQKLKLKYQRIANHMQNTSDYMDLPTIYQEIPIIYATARGWYKLQDAYNGDKENAKYENKKLDAIEKANRNQTNEPLTIRTYI